MLASLNYSTIIFDALLARKEVARQAVSPVRPTSPKRQISNWDVEYTCDDKVLVDELRQSDH